MGGSEKIPLVSRIQSVVDAQLSELSQAQRERLAYVDLKAYFCGELTRADIEQRFGMKPAASSRDLAAYRKISPDNLAYEPSLRRHVPTERFRPVFPHAAERVLSWLRDGMSDGLDLGLKLPVLCDRAGSLRTPNLDTLAVLTRAIAAKRLCQVEYLSLKSGRSTRVLAPTALIDTGHCWQLRAFDRKSKRFSDFVLTRIAKAQPLTDASKEEERIGADTQWARIVTIKLGPHPGVKHPEAIEADFGMKGGMVALDMRAPLVGYALLHWAVDCSPQAALDPKQHHLRLLNAATLYGVESAYLAPGHQPEKSGVDEAL
jgi:hypothetical protein